MKPSLVSPLTSIFLVEAVIQRCSMKLVIISPTPNQVLTPGKSLLPSQTNSKNSPPASRHINNSLSVSFP